MSAQRRFNRLCQRCQGMVAQNYFADEDLFLCDQCTDYKKQQDKILKYAEAYSATRKTTQTVFEERLEEFIQRQAAENSK